MKHKHNFSSSHHGHGPFQLSSFFLTAPFLTPTSDSHDAQQETQAQLKCRIAELEAEVTAQRTQSQPHSSKTYMTMGRAINKIVSLFDPIEAMVSEYDDHQELEETCKEGDDTPIPHTDEQNAKSYAIFRGISEGFDSTIALQTSTVLRRLQCSIPASALAIIVFTVIMSHGPILIV
ncbi:hypothetical protein C8R45DRAFT_923750 [Mycena sanguinolenta]|nr:hypothetical protein C8R45DRAFT_923750 [Mycena sanguinolenta]